MQMIKVFFARIWTPSFTSTVSRVAKRSFFDFVHVISSFCVLTIETHFATIRLVLFAEIVHKLYKTFI